MSRQADRVGLAATDREDAALASSVVEAEVHRRKWWQGQLKRLRLAMALHLGVLTVGLAYWLYGRGLRHLPVPTVVTLTLAEPLTASVLGVAVLGERLGAAGWAGAAVVAAGLVVAGRTGRPRQAGATVSPTMAA